MGSNPICATKSWIGSSWLSSKINPTSTKISMTFFDFGTISREVTNIKTRFSSKINFSKFSDVLAIACKAICSGLDSLLGVQEGKHQVVRLVC